MTTARTAASGTCPSDAATPPRMATVSPGTTKPTKIASSTKTTVPTTRSTSQTGAWSTSLVMVSSRALTEGSSGGDKDGDRTATGRDGSRAESWRLGWVSAECASQHLDTHNQMHGRV